MEGQSNWYYGETWIKERSAELVGARREAIHNTRSYRPRRERVEPRRRALQRERSLRRLLAGIDPAHTAEPTAGLRQRVSGWVLRLVGGLL